MRAVVGTLVLLIASAGPASRAAAQVPAFERAGAVDDAGRRVLLAAPPRRIVSLVPVVTEILFAIGAGDRIVGRSSYDDYPLEVLNVPSVGDPIRPSVELVLRRSPELVILVGGPDNSGGARELERLGVATFIVRINTLADLERNIHRLGRLVERTEAAARLWTEISADLAVVTEATRDLPRPGVYYDAGYPPNVTIGAGSYLNRLIAIAGGRNVFASLAAPSPQVSLEAIAIRNPDVVIHPVSAHRGDRTPRPADRPGWSAIRAVREGAVLEVDADVIHRLGPRVARAARILAEALHPGAVADLASAEARP